MAVITEAGDNHGPLPLGVPEQAPPAVPITSEGDIAIKHKVLFLSPLWELTQHATENSLVTLQILLELITTSQGLANRSNLCHLPAGLCFC